MDPIEPAYSVDVLLLIAALAVAGLLFLIMKVKTTLKTWTVMETTLGLTIFAPASILWLVV